MDTAKDDAKKKMQKTALFAHKKRSQLYWLLKIGELGEGTICLDGQ